MLVDLNAVTRSLDLACKILSPTVAGLIMTYVSLEASAGAIAAWNVVSLCAEYMTLSHVYRLTPALASKHYTRRQRQCSLCLSVDFATFPFVMLTFIQTILCLHSAY